MIVKPAYRILTALFALVSALSAFGQVPASRSYDLELLAAKYVDTTKFPEILLLFKYTPKPGKPFKPVFSSRMTYQFEGQAHPKTELLDTGGHSITFYGRDIDKKSPFIYSLIAHKIDTASALEFGIVVFQLRNLSAVYVPRMQYRYGLWEPDNTDIRFEEDYLIDIQQ